MNTLSRKSLSILALAVAAGLSACSSTPTEEGAPTENRQVPSGPTVAPVDLTASRSNNIKYPELNDPRNILSKRSIYFDYDRYDIKADFKDIVAAHAKFLVAHRDAHILIQGNTDDRGSREYNLALGQKRADAVKKALLLLGAREDQIESVSLGEEKPKAQGENESAWAENRRADILYKDNGEF